MDYYKIGQRIRKYRNAYNLTQEQLADKIGISPTHMSHIEPGNPKLSLAVLVNIAKELSVQTDELLFDKPKISKTEVAEEIISTLESCSLHDMYILSDVIKAVKISLEKHENKK